MIIVFFVCAALLYLAAAVYISRGIRANYALRQDSPPVSIVVPVRNEEQTLGTLLNSFLALDYPRDRLELILVDDQSEDGTRAIAEAFRSRGDFDVRVISVDDADTVGLTAKTRPLAVGIEHAKHEYVLMTDADCVVPPGWVHGMVSHFVDGVAMVCGITIPDANRRPPNWFTLFETSDWLFLLGVCAGFSGQRNAQALIGNNYAIRASSYKRLGTYRNIAHNKIDDIALMIALQRDGKETIVMPVTADVLAKTAPLNTIRELASQRYRWLRAWPFAPSLVRIAIGVGIASHVLWPIAAIVIGYPAILFLLAIMLGDAVVIHGMRKRLRVPLAGYAVSTFAIFATIYSWILTFDLLTRKRIEWKQREF